MVDRVSSETEIINCEVDESEHANAEIIETVAVRVAADEGIDSVVIDTKRAAIAAMSTGTNENESIVTSMPGRGVCVDLGQHDMVARGPFEDRILR